MCLWFVLLGLLLRRPNRTRHAWTILLPLLAIYLVLHVVEHGLNSYFVFHLHINICSLICESLRFLALSMAVLLAVSDLIKVRSGLLRFILVFLVLFFGGSIGTLLNVSAILSPRTWTIVFGFVLLVFMAGQGAVGVLLRRLFGRSHLTWFAVVCLVLGVCPILILGSIGWVLNRSPQLQSTQEFIRTSIVLSQVISAPHFVFFWFVLLALLSPFYRRRLTRCFACDTPQDPAPGQGRPGM
ncbi:MAG: hypothetical protein ACYS4W_02350 [Planctomycetota bacterium]